MFEQTFAELSYFFENFEKLINDEREKLLDFSPKRI